MRALLFVPCLAACGAAPSAPPAWTLDHVEPPAHRGLGEQGAVAHLSFGLSGRLLVGTRWHDAEGAVAAHTKELRVSPGDVVWAGAGARAIDLAHVLGALTALMPTERANKVRAAASPLPAEPLQTIMLAAGQRVATGSWRKPAHATSPAVPAADAAYTHAASTPGPLGAGPLCLYQHHPGGEGVPPAADAERDRVTGCVVTPKAPGAWEAWVTFVPLTLP